MPRDDLDPVFTALAHPDRRAILDRLAERPGMATGEIAAGFSVSRVQVMKHLKILEDAALVIARKEGRVRRHWLNAAPLQRICDLWTDRYGGFWATRMVDIKERVESRRTTGGETRRTADGSTASGGGGRSPARKERKRA